MLTLIQAIILGIIQGITEWLPVSSSGHLVIFQQLFGLELPVFFNVLLHLGTLTVIITVFWEDIIKIVKALIRRDFNSEYGKLLIFIIIGSIPTAFIGLIFHDILVSLFSNLLAVGTTLISTGTLLFFCERRENKKDLTAKNSLLIGLAQGLAIIPGVSRSGATIGTGLLRGIDRDKLTRFSFLLFIPAVIGAGILEARNVIWSDFQWLSAIIGVIVSGIVGYFSLKLLMKFVKEKKLKFFSWYCWALGMLVIVFYLL